MYSYEGMFLVDPVLHGADPAGIQGKVTALLEKHGAKVHDFEKWDERRLAYEIKGHKRGVYFLTHFEMASESVVELRKDCRITECILRHMLLRLEDDIPTYLQRSAAYYEKMKQDQELRRGERDDRPGRKPERPAAGAATEDSPVS